MRVVSAVRNVRIRNDVDLETIEVVVQTDKPYPFSEAAVAAQSAAESVAGEDKLYVPVGSDFVTVGVDCVSFVWMTANKP